MKQKQPKLVLEDNGFFERFMSPVANWLNTHWIIKTIIQFFPSVWSPIVMTGLGTILGLKNNSVLTTSGWIAVVIVYLAALFISIVSGYKAKRDAQQNIIWASEVDEYVSAIGLLNTMFDSEHALEKSIVQHTLEQSCNVVLQKSDAEKIRKLYSPKHSMQEINKQLKACFAKITSLHKRDILISSLVSLDGKNWAWIDRDDVYSGLSLEELVQEGTTFYEICSGRTSFAYANDKSHAANGTYKYKYRYDKKDLEKEAKGSIICWQVTIGDGNRVIAQAIINISTYNKKFADGLDNQTAIDSLYNDTIRNHILKHFEGEIQLALTAYYLSAVANQSANK